MTTSLHLNHLQNLIHTYTRRLHLLKEQQAMRGLNTPPEILLEIEDIEARLEQLQTELAEVKSGSEPASQPTDLTYLHEQLALYQSAQRTTPAPQRFQLKIDELETTIANWEGRVEQQRQRIMNGLSGIRQKAAEPEQAKKRLSVVGQRPLDVIDHFKNRVREQETIGKLLAEPTTRLVSLIGHGGMGKTALACKILRDLEHHNWSHTDEDIQWDGLVYLSTRTAGISLERLFLDCAKMLGGEQEKRLHTIWTNPKLNTFDKISYLLTALTEGRYVILLDNVEDLLDGQGQLVDQDLQLFFEQSLSQAHGTRLLLTSRQALTLRREVMRFDRQVKLLAGLPIDDGVALLRELDPNGDYGLRDAPKEQLAEAVSLVHGVPRALEVIAGILANDPFATLAEVLASFYEQADVVQALIEENYKRLDTEARRVIEALAVFKRPVLPPAVDYLLEPFAPGLDVPGILRRLTRTNIVSIDRANKMVTLHPIDQDYAYNQLSEKGVGEPAYTRQALERRAADYYAQLRTPEETWKTINDLEPQLAEFGHRVRARDYDGACQVMNPIDTDYLYRWGHYVRLAKMRERLLERLADPSLLAANLGGLGRACHSLGQVERAIEFHEHAVDITREIGDRAGEGLYLRNLGNAYYSIGRLEQAIKIFGEALIIARETGDRRAEGYCLSSLGLAYYSSGRVKRAKELCEEAVAIAREIGDRWLEGNSLGTLGTANRTLGQVERAIELHEEALSVARNVGARWVEGTSLGNLGLDHRALGQTERAIQFYEEALVVAREIGDRRKEAVWLGNKGHGYRTLGQLEQAIQLYKEALVIARETGDRQNESYYLGFLGIATYALGQVSQAAKFYKEALTIAREAGYRRIEVIWLGNLGVTYHTLGQFKQAIKLHEKALTIARETGYRLGESYQLLRLGRALLAIMELPDARRLLAEALALDVPDTSYQAALAMGIVLLHQRHPDSAQTFGDAATRCRSMLDKTAGLYEPSYFLAAALLGRAVCNPNWADRGERGRLLAPALDEYRRALEICAAPGVVEDALRDMKLIKAAGIEGLEPVFELLIGAVASSD